MMIQQLSLLGLFLACGDKDTEDTATVDDTSAETDADSDADPDPMSTLVYTSSDYAVYALGTLGLTDGELNDEITTLPGGGSLVKTLSDGRVYNLNQTDVDVLRVYDAGLWSAPLHEISLGDGTANPQDVVLCGGELFVSMFESTKIQAYNPETLTLNGIVDLVSVADDDGIPNNNGLFCKEDNLIAVSQRLGADWTSASGMVSVINPATKTITNNYPTRSNPRMFHHPTDDHLFFLISGNWSIEGDGGISTFDWTTGVESDFLVADADHGVTFNNLVATETHMMVTAGDAAYMSQLYCFDMSDWSATLVYENASYFGVIEMDDSGKVWLGVSADWNDSTTLNGLQAYDVDTCIAQGDLVPTSLAPYSITFY